MLMNVMLDCLDLDFSDQLKQTSELEEDVQFAMRMYRQGMETNLHGLEFLAKFSVLECLVCGPEKSHKEDLLIKEIKRSIRRRSPQPDSRDKKIVEFAL